MEVTDGLPLVIHSLIIWPLSQGVFLKCISLFLAIEKSLFRSSRFLLSSFLAFFPAISGSAPETTEPPQPTPLRITAAGR